MKRIGSPCRACGRQTLYRLFGEHSCLDCTDMFMRLFELRSGLGKLFQEFLR